MTIDLEHSRYLKVENFAVMFGHQILRLNVQVAICNIILFVIDLFQKVNKQFDKNQ